MIERTPVPLDATTRTAVEITFAAVLSDPAQTNRTRNITNHNSINNFRKQRDSLDLMTLTMLLQVGQEVFNSKLLFVALSNSFFFETQLVNRCETLHHNKFNAGLISSFMVTCLENGLDDTCDY